MKKENNQQLQVYKGLRKVAKKNIYNMKNLRNEEASNITHLDGCHSESS